uniref:Indoleamine 2,3-dioxygenase n=1 Tax=Volvox ferrisii TaxID=1075618 RepID=A0A075M2C4_9CHLO|nr:indoleamine 2,3-dioxygenase [Volvox ferrisii]
MRSVSVSGVFKDGWCASTRQVNSQRRIPVIRALPEYAKQGFHATSPFEHITSERGFLPLHDPQRRLQLASHDTAAAEWEAALTELPHLAAAAAAAAAAITTTGSGGSTPPQTPPSSSHVIKGPLRRRLERLPPFPLHKLLPQSASSSPPPPLPASCSSSSQGTVTAAASPTTATAAAVTAAEDGGGGGGGSELWRAYSVLSFLAHGYMWCEPGPPPAVLPAVLAVPWAAVASAIGMPPVLTYATYNLLNWRRLETEHDSSVALGNIVCLQNFLGGPDEEWFRCVHVEVEAQAGPAVAGLTAMQTAAAAGDAVGVTAGLRRITRALQLMQSSLSRMGEGCDPYIYYHRVRTPMSGWRGNPALPQGLIYEGVSDVPVQLYGETGAQSSVLPAFDAALGIEHDLVWLRDYLDAMTSHMPPHHRAFIAQLAAANTGPGNVRAFVLSYSGGGSDIPAPSSASDAAVSTNTDGRTGSTAVVGCSTDGRSTDGNGGRPVNNEGVHGAVSRSELRDAYNEAVMELERFRGQHRGFAYSYIAKWGAKGQEERTKKAAAVEGGEGDQDGNKPQPQEGQQQQEQRGTGGSDFMPALGAYRETTSRHVIR